MLEKLESPSQLPLSLQLVKAHLRLDHPDDDAYLTHLIHSGTMWVENYLGRSLLAQQWRWIKKHRPQKKTNDELKIILPRSPLLHLSYVKIKNSSFSLPYQVEWDKDPVCIAIPPSASRNELEIVFTTGYGERPGDIPLDIQQAILTYVTCLYEYRTGIDRKHLIGIYDLLTPHRLVRLS